MAKTIVFDEGYMQIQCPGCKHGHEISIDSDRTREAGVPIWGYNGNVDKPTFTPSLLVRTGVHAGMKRMEDDTDEDWQRILNRSSICHSQITDGKIYYYNDTTHELKGQTIELPEYKNE
jgi:hypothetical protein